ncbi:hypothetical protein ACLI4Y_03600 [Natrialbaceae archaeon A-CW3]
MYPVDAGMHGYLGVQAAVFVHVVLTLAATAVMWWLVVPTNLTVVVFLAVGTVLLVPFWSVYSRLHPEHDKGE